jgi:hypothetical protein
MTREELDMALSRLGLNVPEIERSELVKAAHFIEEMANSVKKSRPASIEPAHIVSFPKE